MNATYTFANETTVEVVRTIRDEYTRPNVEAWRPTVDCFRIINMALPHDAKVKVGISTQRKVNQYKVTAESNKTLEQIGRAVALLPFYVLIGTHIDLQGKEWTVIQHKHESKRIAISAGLNRVMTSEKVGLWHKHLITRGLETKGFLPTKYHFLVALLTGNRVFVNRADFSEVEANMRIEDGFQREMWRVAGYDWRDYPHFSFEAASVAKIEEERPHMAAAIEKAEAEVGDGEEMSVASRMVALYHEMCRIEAEMRAAA